MMRVLVADDEAPARGKLQRWLSEQSDVQVIAESEDGLHAAEAIERLKPDVAFLDIQMPGLSGLEVAAQLEQETAPLIVFVTAFDEHAIKAFELNAIDYLLKPYDKDRLLKTLVAHPRATSRWLSPSRRRDGSRSDSVAMTVCSCRWAKRCSSSIAPRSNGLKPSDNYVHVHTTARSYILRRTLQDLLEQLGDRQFARIHKSAAVNIAAVKAFTPLFKGDYEVQLRNGKVLRLSRRFKDQLFGRMGR